MPWIALRSVSSRPAAPLGPRFHSAVPANSRNSPQVSRQCVSFLCRPFADQTCRRTSCRHALPERRFSGRTSSLPSSIFCIRAPLVQPFRRCDPQPPSNASANSLCEALQLFSRRPVRGQIWTKFEKTSGTPTRMRDTVPLQFPNGERGGVPPSAASVPLAGVLAKSDPVLAAQVTEPSTLLLPRRLRPLRLQRCHTMVAKGYPHFVRRCVGTGLHCMRPRRSIFKFRGRP